MALAKPDNSETDTARRRRSRLRTALAARLISLSGTREVTLLDLSLTGARIGLPSYVDGGLALSPDATVVLQWAQFERIGHVVWRSDRTAGIAFDEIVEPKDLLATRDLQDEVRNDRGRDYRLAENARRWVQGGP